MTELPNIHEVVAATQREKQRRSVRGAKGAKRGEAERSRRLSAIDESLGRRANDVAETYRKRGTQ